VHVILAWENDYQIAKRNWQERNKKGKISGMEAGEGTKERRLTRSDQGREKRE